MLVATYAVKSYPLSINQHDDMKAGRRNIQFVDLWVNKQMQSVFQKLHSQLYRKHWRNQPVICWWLANPSTQSKECPETTHWSQNEWSTFWGGHWCRPSLCMQYLENWLISRGTPHLLHPREFQNHWLMFFCSLQSWCWLPGRSCLCSDQTRNWGHHYC